MTELFLSLQTLANSINTFLSEKSPSVVHCSHRTKQVENTFSNNSLSNRVHYTLLIGLLDSDYVSVSHNLSEGSEERDKKQGIRFE